VLRNIFHFFSQCNSCTTDFLHSDAENPLSDAFGGKARKRGVGSKGPAAEVDVHDDSGGNNQLGSYETEQLISAIAKIADLLRKCWGVAGANIISTNLARNKEGDTVVFNPTVPGRRVYALFSFVAISGFDRALSALKSDIMILINDVSRVVHDEVYRWSLAGSGQCNKNLGASFLMVFRIGDFHDVHNKQKRATDVVFNTKAKRNPNIKRRRMKKKQRTTTNEKEMTIRLSSLPGIQAFTDRAVLGLLKSFAGIHRDRKLQQWKKDFRLGMGIDAFAVNVMYGMDAGWAVEGAVGSEYKIDATYLSPHVNMSARMMTASKQYGVTILMSQAVEELMSKNAREMLRHLDTVFVKGSSVPQRIFTYDARYQGVDFFLIERSPEQAEFEAEAYKADIWEKDQDLSAMRQHISDDFLVKFRMGIEEYLAGRWSKAIVLLKEADDAMMKFVIEEGYFDYILDEYDEDELLDRNTKHEDIIRLQLEYGDGPSKCLVQYMERRDAQPPEDWAGVRQLMSK
jgi:class 3 adenylate cyclase